VNSIRKKLAILAVAVSISTPLVALQPLHEDRTVISGFYAIGVADLVRRNCDDISPRYLRAYNYLKALEKYALKAGYSEAQIEELTDNREEKEILRARIEADLASRGASPQTPQGYCTVGREEIAKNSAAGRLLRAK
jgi:hypothetical protein